MPFWSKSKDVLRRDARTPYLAKHGTIVSDGTLYKCGREYSSWHYRRYDLHEDNFM